MGLQSVEIDVPISNVNCRYYRDRGYQIPEHSPHGEKTIRVKINDLPHNSMQPVEIICDVCDKKIVTTYQAYCRYQHDGLYYCTTCSTKLRTKEKSARWNVDLDPIIREKRRDSSEYHDFTLKVLKRDNYTCLCCGSHSSLCVHHLDGFHWCNEKRMDTNNGVTLCKRCHRIFHKKYGNKCNTKEQFEEWVNHSIDQFSEEIDLSAARRVICLETHEVFDSVYRLSKEKGLMRSQVYKACNRQESLKYGQAVKSIYGYHYLWLDDYINMSEKEYEEYLYWINNRNDNYGAITGGNHYRARKVICLTTQDIFDTITDASRVFGASAGDISKCCKHKKLYAGKLPDGTKLEWLYYEEYDESFNKKQLKIA